MPEQDNSQTTGRKETTTQITDFDGTVILEIGQQEYTIRNPDKSITHRKLNESIRLVCGTIWNVMLMSKVFLGVCQQCRKGTTLQPKTHGLVAISRARMCIDCGVLSCPRHYRLGKDKKYRCLKHHKLHLLNTLAKPIFFRQLED